MGTRNIDQVCNTCLNANSPISYREKTQMDEREWLAEFAVTPLISHAIAVVRGAILRRGDIPAGGEGVIIDQDDDGQLDAVSFRVEPLEGDQLTPSRTDEDIELTDEQRAAAEFLIATLAYHAALIKAMGQSFVERSKLWDRLKGRLLEDDIDFDTGPEERGYRLMVMTR